MRVLLCCLGLLSPLTVMLLANNISISNPRLTGRDEGTQTTSILVDVSWDNSWRVSAAPGNYDAAWIFVKYRLPGGEWEHARLAAAPAITSGSHTVDVADDGAGAFVYRATTGSGSVSFTDVTLPWHYGATGVDDCTYIEIQAFALEMVYVPTGAYSLGASGGAEAYPLLASNGAGGYTTYTVGTENAITMGTAAGNLTYGPGSQGNPGDGSGPIPAAFPKGYAGFYCMKYELTQGEYVAFFNALTPSQQSALDVTGPSGKNVDFEQNQNDVVWDGTNDATSGMPAHAINYLTPLQCFAYLDWAGLRPMTELEFEKTARGIQAAVTSEYVWSTTTIFSNRYSVQNYYATNEYVINTSTSLGNAAYAGAFHKNKGRTIRPGGMAANPSITFNRQTAGAGYYGNMELAGNVYELVVSIGDAQGRSFSGTHGDGLLTTNGEADVVNWPTVTTGYGIRGGGYTSPSDRLRTSDRFEANYTFTTGSSDIGFRGVHTAD